MPNFLNDKTKKILTVILKVIAVALFSLYIVRLFFNDYFIWIINGGRYGDLYYEARDIPQSIVRWSYTTAICLIPTAAFFKSKTLSKLTILFSVLALVLNLIYFNETFAYFVRNSDRAIYIQPNARKVYFIFELSLMLAFTVLYAFMNCKNLLFTNLKQLRNFFIYLPFIPLICLPVYFPQSIWGFTQIKMDYFSLPQILWILMIFATFFILVALYRNDTKEHKEIICCFLTIFLFQHYNSIYLMDLNASRLPFQLCNLGSYFILILFLFRKYKPMQKFFDFSFIANVPGAFVAIIAVDVNRGICSFWNIHYYLEHTWVFLLPLLFFALGIYKFPKEHALKHFFIGYTCYFIGCATLGIIFNCVLFKPETKFFNEVNYFYLFNALVLQVFSFAAFTRKWGVVWNEYTFYPLYMLFVYFGFMIICFASHILNDKLYRVGKEHDELRRLKIELREEKHNA